MQLEIVRTNLLKPYENNPRKHSPEQVALIAKSIKEFGFNQPIVVDENYIVLVGHGRLEALKSLGVTDTSIIIKKGLTEAQKKAYRILDNKLQNDSDWNYQELEIELQELEDLDFSLDAWGLTDLLVAADIESVGGDTQGKLDEMEIKTCPHCHKQLN